MPNLQIVGGTQAFQDILDEFKDFETRLTKEPPPKIIALKDDPVVLACAAYRMYQENPRHRWMDFDQVVVWHADREEAERLKAYYRNRFAETTFNMLKRTNNRGLSSFRRKLYLLATNDLQITEREIGLLHRLPYFYAEDLALDEIMQSMTSVAEHIPAHKQTLNLTLIKKVLRSRNAGESNQYWFRDDTNSYAYMLPVQTDNILANFFDSMADKPMAVEAMVVCKQMQGRTNYLYFQLASPRVLWD
jgi:hypothetical protein